MSVMAEKRQVKRSIWVMLFGWACVAIGLAGVVLPIIPGIPFLVVGLVSLSSQHRWVRSLVISLKRRFKIPIPTGKRPVVNGGPGPDVPGRSSKPFWKKS
jgi:hypothetical protein